MIEPALDVLVGKWLGYIILRFDKVGEPVLFGLAPQLIFDLFICVVATIGHQDNRGWLEEHRVHTLFVVLFAFRELLNIVETFEAVDLRHLVVHENDVTVLHLSFFEGLQTVEGEENLNPLDSVFIFLLILTQLGLNTAQVFNLVVGHEDSQLLDPVLLIQFLGGFDLLLFENRAAVHSETGSIAAVIVVRIAVVACTVE